MSTLATVGRRSASAQGRTTRIVVAVPAGGATDTVARLVGQSLHAVSGVPVIVDNKPGGFFIPAGTDVMNARPDGSTLYMISTSNLIAQPLHRAYPFDLRQFTPITEVASGPLVLVARNSLPVRALSELVTLARQDPGRLTIGLGGGAGSSFHLAGELLQSRADFKMTGVPYRGAAPALSDLLAGTIDLMFDAMPAMTQQIRSGAVRAIAITGPTRSAALPDIPTVIEAGVPDFDVEGWFGLLAPPNTPAAIASQIRDDVAKVLAMPEVRARLGEQGLVAVGSEPETWHRYLLSEFARWSRVISDGKITSE